MSGKIRKVDALVVGGGPAGLMAAETVGSAGKTVLLAEAMPTVGRKFLMAGKSGLNLTKDEPMAEFLVRFKGANPEFLDSVRAFGPGEVADWACGLGEQVFTGSTGRVFPRAMKASPLLRRWLSRLSDLGIDIQTRWRWSGWEGQTSVFDTPDGQSKVEAKTTIFALGGASWPKLGSNASWVEAFQAAEVDLTPFRPSNMGFSVQWSSHMRPYFGVPVKGTRLTAGDATSRGEWVISTNGVEGGGIYEVSQALRDGAELKIDLLPDRSLQDVQERLSRPRGGASLANHLRKTLKLTAVARALLNEFARPESPEVLSADTLKHLPIALQGPYPIERAISTAGGVRWSALDGLMLRKKPGVFVAGEMLDWEAPTGGYLLTGCLASGRRAGLQAGEYLQKSVEGNF